ncbi:hypothetical protein AC579_2086 [Pseudocercospora musae]|uniref:Enoyl reductase (ER) domain-containing protein n=1 Tax=Pseudocercospora musae TaxID=113226 RepID=A0A139I5F7_9PEZI|nr:hypothetical protein AC579_2086 [Pseudocercospora musae]
MAVDPPFFLPEAQQAIKVIEAGVIRLEKNIPLPPVGEEDVLVRVHCVALNPFDWKSLDLSPAAGSTHGCDVSGEIVAVGSKCRQDLRVGDRVLGPVKGNFSDGLENGGFAQFAAIHQLMVWHIPEGMTFAQAATLGLSLMTVGLALHYMLQVQLPLAPAEPDGPGDYVFIYGGGTATATLAIQTAALSGMQVVCACSPRHFERLRLLGASACFDYHSATVGEDIRKFTNGRLTKALDCITDSASMSICYDALGDHGGRYVGLDQFPIRSHTRRDVRPEWILAWTVFGEAIRWKRPYAKAPRPKHKLFAEQWQPVVQKLLDSGLLATHPMDLRSGGLGAIPEGIDMLRKGKTGGGKLVYSIV